MFNVSVLHRAGRFVVLSGTVATLSLFAGIATAAQPDPSEDKGVPQYIAAEFEQVRAMLQANAEKLDNLSAQLAAVEAGLQSDIATATSEIKAEMDVLGGDLDDVLTLLNEPDKDIELTTEICFDLGAKWEWAYTGKIAGGVGIEAGLSGEAQLELVTPGLLPLLIPSPAPVMVPIVPGVEAAVSDTVCLTVPLYAVASNDHWIADFDTGEFDSVVSAAAMPAQFLLPALAHAFGQVMPDPADAMGMVADGLAVFDPNETTSSRSVQMSGGAGSGNTVLTKGLTTEQAVQAIALASHQDMMMSSPLLQEINEQNSIGDAFANPCSFAAGFDLPAADAIAAGCSSTLDFFWDIFDPFCWLDPLHVGHCAN